MDTPITPEPDPNLPDWHLSPHTRLVSHRLATRGFSIVHAMIEFPGSNRLATAPKDTLDMLILDAKTRGGVAYFAVLRNVHDELIEARLEGDDSCWLRSDSIDVKQLLGEGWL